MDVHSTWVHWCIDGIFTFFLEVTHCRKQKKKLNQKECNKCKAGVYVGVGDGVHNNRHLVDPFQNGTTVYGMKNCSHSGK